MKCQELTGLGSQGETETGNVGAVLFLDGEQKPSHHTRAAFDIAVCGRNVAHTPFLLSRNHPSHLLFHLEIRNGSYPFNVQVLHRKREYIFNIALLLMATFNSCCIKLCSQVQKHQTSPCAEVLPVPVVKDGPLLHKAPGPRHTTCPS